MESLLTKADNLEPWLRRITMRHHEKANPFWSNYFKA